jgi:endonuclease III related protein
MRKNKTIKTYKTLYTAYGPQHWWPAKTPFEVCIGAILTQSTSWKNVEKAIKNLKNERILNPKAIATIKPARLANLIRPSLYYNVKAKKLKEFVKFISKEYGGKVENMRKTPINELRTRLLHVWGLGPETVDSILLYALDKPSFVVDAYTKRVFSRLDLVQEDASYDEVKALFESSLPRDAALFNEYHALIVEHGKNVCRTKPLCDLCCLRDMCLD